MTIDYKSYLLTILILVQLSQAFLITPNCRAGFSPLRVLEEDQEVLFGSGELEEVTTTSDASLFFSLKNRQGALQNGIGKRYVTRTQKGFLNIHYEPSDPYDTNNIVNQLAEGQIVTSTGPQRGAWIPHDAGGWSISKFGGFTWLEPIDE